MKKINKGKIIICPDIHQNLKWANTILEKEETFDSCVFLGDHFDTYEFIDNEEHFSVMRVCEWINEKMQDERFVWLLGNHDLSYLSSYRPNGRVDRKSFYLCSGWTKSKAENFNKYINPKWFDKIELCCKVGDYYCSHAGFHESHFGPTGSAEDNIEKLYKAWENEKRDFIYKPYHWIGHVGACRGGDAKVGSPCWLDWRYEFKPIENIFQIVGHTQSLEPRDYSEVIIEKDNFCIDSGQKTYMVWENGKLFYKKI